MTQAISVYISKTIFGLEMILNLEQLKYMTDVKPLYITIWNKSYYNTEDLVSVICSTNSGESAVIGILRSDKQHITFHFTYIRTDLMLCRAVCNHETKISYIGIFVVV